VTPDLLVIQARHRTRRRDPTNRTGALRVDDHGVVTYVLSASTGNVLTRQVGAPFFLGASSGREIIAYNDEPFPQVYLVRASAAR
jgi:hypothetical protein